jgi:hypothetical protein
MTVSDSTVGKAIAGGCSPVKASEVGSGSVVDCGAGVGVGVSATSVGAGRAVPTGSSRSAESTAESGERRTSHATAPTAAATTSSASKEVITTATLLR